MSLAAAQARAASDEFFQAGTLNSAGGMAGDFTGGAVALSADGSTMVVGVPDANSRQGEAYVYTRGANGWQTSNQPAVLTASNGAQSDEFGSSVAISADGSVIAVGAPYAAGTAGGDERGAVYVFNRPSGGWAPQSTQSEKTSAPGAANFDDLGYSVAVSPDGTYLTAGAIGYSSSAPLTGQGGIYVYSYNGTALSAAGVGLLTASDPGNEDQLGHSLAMPNDSLIYAGAPYHPGNSGPGAVYGFSSESSIEVGYGPWDHVSQTELAASGSNVFGAAVAAAGGIVAAGAPDTGSNLGAVYLYQPAFGCLVALVHGCFRSSSSTTPTATLTDPSGSGYLGQSVALTGDGTALLAGAPGYAATPPAPPGNAFLFQEPSGGWGDSSTPAATLKPSDSSTRDDAGWAVALSSDGGALAIGAPSGSGLTAGEADVWEGRTQTLVGCQPDTVGVGQPTTCTATITDEGIGEATPTGTVDFSSDSSGSFGGDASCTLPTPMAATGVNSCQLTYTPSAADSGMHTLTASYSGDDAHAPGIDQTTVAINRITTVTAFSCSPAPVVIGTSTMCKATVTAAQATAGPPTGTVTFTTAGPGSFSAARCTLPAASGASAGCAVSYTPSAVGPGTHQLTAAYGGDGGHAASEGSDPLGVSEASTRTSVSCAPLSIAVGHAATCLVTVTDAGTGGLAPTGSVTLKSTGAGNFSGCTLTAHGSGSSSCSFSYHPANAAAPSPKLTATYVGDDEHFGSAASALLSVRATGTPKLTIGRTVVKGGHMRLTLGCPKTEAYCAVTVSIRAGARVLVSGSIRVAGGSARVLGLAPNAAVLRLLGAGRHGLTATLTAADQSSHHRQVVLTGHCVIGSDLKLVSLTFRR